MKRLTNQYFDLISSQNIIISRLKYYFIFNSHFNLSLSRMFETQYNVYNFLNNDKQALFARIDYVERNEPRSYYNAMQLPENREIS